MLKIYLRISLILLLSSQCITLQAATDSRHALVIGNSIYKFASPLENPANDSADIAKALTKLHFNTVLIQDATKDQIDVAVSQFLAVLKNDGGTGLFYYAGHGVQLQGDNYLVPVETNLGTDQQIQNQSYNINTILTGMRSIKTSTNIIILDACRDNPFKNVSIAGSRSVGDNNARGLVNKNIPKLNTGLSKLDAPPNTIIAFATAPGRVALDGDKNNSPYTLSLIKAMKRSGLTIGQMFQRVRADVLDQTNGEQVPWESSSLIEDFYFKPRITIPMGF